MNPAAWSLRNLLGPVVARLLILGVNPMDLEGVLARLERSPIPNARALETRWLAEWRALAGVWTARADAALAAGRRLTARNCRFHASTCGLAGFLVNTSDLAVKKQVYLEYAAAHRAWADLAEAPVETVSVPCAGGFELSALLHLPAGDGPHPVALVLAGLGSCKEEMATLARALADRGVAALVPDMPGCGETLFVRGIPCSMDRVEAAIRGLADFSEAHARLDASRLGAVGLCMGGGYAFRAASLEPRVRHAGLLFPLFIPQVDLAGIPQWMKSGPWTEFQTGGAPMDAFIASMGPAATDAPEVPVLFVHGRHDNWMTWDSAQALFERVRHPGREFVTLENDPVVTGGNATTHAMPVGEQMHWVVPMVADWIAERSGAAPA